MNPVSNEVLDVILPIHSHPKLGSFSWHGAQLMFRALSVELLEKEVNKPL